MKFLALLALVVSLNAHATGGFDCVGFDGTEKVEIYGSTGHVPGNPLVSEVGLVSGSTQMSFSKQKVVGYWNMGRDLRLAILDENAENIIVKLEARFKKNSPEAKGKLTLADGKTIKVNCEAE